jgi:hypothetical protein
LRAVRGSARRRCARRVAPIHAHPNHPPHLGVPHLGVEGRRPLRPDPASSPRDTALHTLGTPGRAPQAGAALQGRQGPERHRRAAPGLRPRRAAKPSAGGGKGRKAGFALLAGAAGLALKNRDKLPGPLGRGRAEEPVADVPPTPDPLAPAARTTPAATPTTTGPAATIPPTPPTATPPGV